MKCETLRVLAASGILISAACDETPGAPSHSTRPAVHIVFRGSTSLRSDLPSSAQACAAAILGFTHIHPSWQNFAAVALRAVPPDRYDVTFTDVPVSTRVSFRVNDSNFCDENPTGAVTRNIFANDVPLVQNTTTPGNGEEAGYSMIVATNGTITQ